jgi:hypothetical protein
MTSRSETAPAGCRQKEDCNMTDQFIAATPGYVAIFVTHFTDGREPHQRSWPIIGWRLLTTDGYYPYATIPVCLGEQPDASQPNYVGIVQPDGRVFWSREFYPDQPSFMSAVLAAETKRRARVCCGCGRDDNRPDDPWEAYSVDRYGPDWMHASCLKRFHDHQEQADEAVRMAIYPKTLVDDFMRTPPPEAAQEYVSYATAWIDALDGGYDGEKRWRSEIPQRNAANVCAEDREALLDRLRARERDVIPY